MNFGELMQHMDHYNGELWHTDYGDTAYSWEWDAQEQSLTCGGREKFRAILESDFLLCEGHIILTSKMSEEDYTLFLMACAGDVDADDYARWFK